ncbi:receptor-like protein 9DC3 [Solanum lycopersicum]|uniref:receptor-like protein 9DC3 n=1 Tax=Solanum lycopersicum TaxID=4081 RepID=UPI000532AE4B
MLKTNIKMWPLLFIYSLFCCVFLRVSFSSSFDRHLCSPNEASALFQFKQSFNLLDFSPCDTSFPKTVSWNESNDCCTWDGVTCDMLTGHVIGLDLSCSRLNGTIYPNSSLIQLHHLRTLNLAKNYFYPSTIPNDVSRLRNLRHLNLSDAYFQGEIPTEISYLSNLVSLDLSVPSYVNGLQFDQRAFKAVLQNLTNLEVLSLFGVDVSSPIPMNLSSSLRYLDLKVTNLEGVLAESFFLLPKLETLYLSNNYLLKGVLPKIHPSSTLLELDISYTGISGELPDSIGTLSSLTRLYLFGCQFSGRIPDSIGNLTQIRYLNFGNNHFTGSIPSTISKLKHLAVLTLSSNSFGGEIPSFFSNLRELRYLSLSNCSFIGPFPSPILSLTQLETLDLSSNSLSGPLPRNGSMLQKLAELDLSYNSLNGTIPSWMFSLPLLSSVSLHHNRLSGSFPQSPVNLTNLNTLDLSSNNITLDAGIQITLPSLQVLLLSSCELKDFPHFLRNVETIMVLDISNNKIRGQIPNWFSGMRWDSLLHLNLSHNSLTGHLQQFHYYSLESLDLKFNSLQGPLPSFICNMSSLSLLDLSNNYFSDSVPHCLGSMVGLSVLDLRRNNFTGSLPSFCEQSNSLRTIVLNGNRFEGTVPMSLLKCDGLEVLDVGNNVINDTFPAWLGTLQELQVLILKSNKFHGPISTRLNFSFPVLRIFDLSHNEFGGSLPAEVFENFKGMIKTDDGDKGEIEYMQPQSYNGFGNVMYEVSVRLVIKSQEIQLEKITTIMTTIDLSSNHFEGVIPKTLKDLSSLWLLNLSHNNLKGDIPVELVKLNTLEALDLSWNRLTGKIPQELTAMNFLSFLNLSRNLLVGRIPQGSQFNTFENDSYGGNLDLCGPPLSKKCGTSDPSHVPQPLEEEEEEDDESYFFSGFTWESVVIGYSFGLVVGTVMWSLMFKYRKPIWFVEIFDALMPHKRRRPKRRALRRRT